MRPPHFWLHVFSVCALVLPVALAEDAPVPAESRKVQPQKVGAEAKLLLEKVTLDFKNADLHWVLNTMYVLTGVEATASRSLGNKTVTLKNEELTLGEVLRQFKDQACAVYRVVDGKLLLATQDEWTAIDAGKAKFEPWVAPSTDVSAPRSDQATLPVDEGAKLLLKKLSMDLENVSLFEAVKSIKEYTGIEVLVSDAASTRALTLKLGPVTVAEALRLIKNQAGAVYRIQQGKILLALPEEWKAIDAGNAAFKPVPPSVLGIYLSLEREPGATGQTLDGHRFIGHEKE